MTKTEYKDFRHNERYRTFLIKAAIKKMNGSSDTLPWEMSSTESLEKFVFDK